MSLIYALGDIHGYYNEMLASLSLVDLKSDQNNKLIFVGDYMSRGPDSCAVLYHIKQLEETYPGQVVVLIGNHDQMFLDWFFSDIENHWLAEDIQLRTTKSFFEPSQWNIIYHKLVDLQRAPFKMNQLIKDELERKHAELIKWLLTKNKSFFYETDNQIYVHAGISEVDPELWKHATEETEFTWKYPAETGSFYKEIIAGHISSAEVADDESYLGRVHWDQESHFFIDGDTPRSRTIPILKYETKTKTYSSFEKTVDGKWIEYRITELP